MLSESGEEILFFKSLTKEVKRLLYICAGESILIGILIIGLLLLDVEGIYIIVAVLIVFSAMLPVYLFIAFQPRSIGIFSDKGLTKLEFLIEREGPMEDIKFYKVTEGNQGKELIARFKKHFFGRKAEILDNSGSEIFSVKDQRLALTLFLTWIQPLFWFLFRPIYLFYTPGSELVGEFNRRTKILDLTSNRGKRLDKRIAIAFSLSCLHWYN
jgi:hypothetical protein